MKKFRWEKKYLYWGITAFCVVVASVLFYMILTRISGITLALKRLMTILSPFVWGLVIAYLMNPVMNIYQRDLFMPLGKKIFAKSKNKDTKTFRFGRSMAVFLTIITLVVAITAVVLLIGPRLYQSLERIVSNSSQYLKTASDWIDRTLADYPEIEESISNTFGNVSTGLFNWLRTSILPQLDGIITNVTSGVYYLVKGVYNVIIGIIVSVYVMYNKEIFGSNLKKLTYCIFSMEAAKRIIKAFDFIDHVFISFISGKILDSCIVGVLCYLVCLILQMPYALLISAIVCITNIIPFFGPFIGAIPCTIILLMESPLKALIFVVFILVLQQFDGNVLGPKILGNSVGINGFWIMFSIILGAGLFGFVGMLLGVPVFVVLFTGIKTLVDRKLQRSGLDTDSDYYKGLDYIDPDTGERVVKQNTRRGGRGRPGGDKKTGSGEKAASVTRKWKIFNMGKDEPEQEENADGKETTAGDETTDGGASKPPTDEGKS